MKNISDDKLKILLEAALFVSDAPISVKKLRETLLAEYNVSAKKLKTVLTTLQDDYHNKGVELIEVASGYRFQAKQSLSEDLQPLYKEKTPRFSKAMLETMALIAYRQPITRGEIEDIRGVAVSSYIMKTLQERNWVKIVGHKEVPGRPALFATTKEFLDYFSLSSLGELPELMPISELSLDENLVPIKETET